MLPKDLGKDTATLRLVLAPGVLATGTGAGAYEAGVEVTMTPGSHTYWMVPGEAGVPPVFAFDGSDNVASAEVRFPVPKRIVEEGIEAYGYLDRVTFPVAVTLRDPAKPAVLRADVTYAVCNRICLPAHSRSEVRIPSGADAAAKGLLAAALAAVPKPIAAGERDKLKIAPLSGGAKPAWTLTWSGSAPVDDMFAAAPDGYFFDTKKIAAGRWRMTAEQIVTAPGARTVPVELTLAQGDGGLLVKEDLDVTPAAK